MADDGGSPVCTQEQTMRRLTLLLPVLFVGLLLGSDSAKDYDDRRDEASIEGTWLLIKLERNGMPTPGSFDTIVAYQGGKFQWSVPPATRTYTVDRSVRPAHLVERLANPLPGTEISGYDNIFQVEGNTLRVACRISGKGFPNGFDGKQEVVVLTYKRVK
jgi:hypothetical protein